MNSIALERNHPIDVSSHLCPADVGGVRALGSPRVILFDEIRYKILLKQKSRLVPGDDGIHSMGGELHVSYFWYPRW